MERHSAICCWQKVCLSIACIYAQFLCSHRLFFAVSVINAERAALASPTFAQKLKRTRRELLQLLCEEFSNKK
jgi:hypothetical protein